jgi:hypothetical protein
MNSNPDELFRLNLRKYQKLNTLCAVIQRIQTKIHALHIHLRLNESVGQASGPGWKKACNNICDSFSRHK